MEVKEKIQIPRLGNFIGQLSSNPEALSEGIREALADIPLIDYKIENAKIDGDKFECTIKLKPVTAVQYVETTIEYVARIPNVDQMELFE